METEQGHFIIYCAETIKRIIIITETVKLFPQALYIVSVKCCNIPNDHKMEQLYKKQGVFVTTSGNCFILHKRYQIVTHVYLRNMLPIRLFYQ